MRVTLRPRRSAVLVALLVGAMAPAAACGGSGADAVIAPADDAAAATDGASSSDATVTTSDGAVVTDAASTDAAVADSTAMDAGVVDATVLGDGGVDGASVVDGGTDARPPRDAGRDGAVVTDADACPPAPTGTNRHVYVDSAANPAVANGSEVCPFRQITDAVNQTTPPGVGQTLTIHVWGEAPGTQYQEPNGVTLPQRTTLTTQWGGAPADPSVVVLRSIGATAHGGVVLVPNASVLEGVTVDPTASSAQHGVVLAALAVTALAPPIVRKVLAWKAPQSGVWVQNKGTLGPGLVARENGTGVRIDGAATIAGPDTHIDKNSGNGLEIAGLAGGTTELTDATASENGNHGVSLSGAGACTFTKLTASKNGGLGLGANGGVTLSLTASNSAFDDNGWSGVLAYPVGASGTGPALSFDDVSASRNAVDGLRLKTHQAVKLGKIVAEGNATSPGAEVGGAGLFLDGTGTYFVREGRFLGNTVGVLVVGQPGSLSLGEPNFGEAGDLGGNVFARAVPGNNAKAGICYLASPKSASIAARGNAWSSCPPAQTAIAKTSGFPKECYSPASYADITFQPAGNGASYDAPLDTGSTTPACTVGN